MHLSISDARLVMHLWLVMHLSISDCDALVVMHLSISVLSISDALVD